MLGDVPDIVGRFRAVLPRSWFSDQSPNLTALLGSLATPASWLHGLIQYVIAQSRLTTATDFWLDLAAFDFFGDALTRRPQEEDASFRQRIQQSLFVPAGTRAALDSVLTKLTGTAPVIFEPARCMDTGAYGSATLASGGTAATIGYGQAGGWGSLDMPYQFFVTVSQPPTPTIANLGGYGTPVGGYGRGSAGYVDLGELTGNVSDAEIESQICRLLPVNATAWLCIK